MAKASADKDVAGPSGTTAVLGRYLARSRLTHPVKTPAVVVQKHTPERAMVMAVGRAAQQSCAMQVFPVQARIRLVTLAELSEILPERGLVLVVEGPQATLGVVALSPGLLASVIEMQSLGRVLSGMPRERRPTRTDASICADLVNAILLELTGELASLGDGTEPGTFRFASHVEDPRPLELMLEDVVYRCFHLNMCLGGQGGREGSLTILLPDISQAGRIMTAPDKADRVPEKPSSAIQADSMTLAAVVQTVPITLDAILCRRHVSLRELRALQPGSLFAMPHAAMETVRVEAPSGHLVVRGKLGVLHGCRAIRIGSHAAAGPVSMAETATGNSDQVTADIVPEQTENVFAPTPAERAGMPSSVLFAEVEPPIDDAAMPDPFRADPDAEAGDPDEGMTKPLNFMSE